MEIKEACEIIEDFAVEYEIDSFTAVEVLVRNMKQLDPPLKRALFTFMDYGKKSLDNKSKK